MTRLLVNTPESINAFLEGKPYGTVGTTRTHLWIQLDGYVKDIPFGLLSAAEQCYQNFLQARLDEHQERAKKMDEYLNPPTVTAPWVDEYLHRAGFGVDDVPPCFRIGGSKTIVVPLRGWSIHLSMSATVKEFKEALHKGLIETTAQAEEAVATAKKLLEELNV